MTASKFSPRHLRQKISIVEILVLLTTAKLLVKYAPFRVWRSQIDGVNNSNVAIASKAQIDQAQIAARRIIYWSRKVPFEVVCLPQALTGRWYLSRRNITSRILIGARKRENDGSLDLHAWLMVGDHCLIGERERAEFREFEYPEDPVNPPHEPHS